MRICFVLLLLLSASVFCDESLISHEVSVNLKNPTYKNGVLFTTDGGVIQNEDIRIQARSIQYMRKNGMHTIEAKGDLLIQYKKRVFIGSELQYDFNEKKGVLYDGKTSINNLYIGSEKIELNPDGSFEGSEAFITTCENKECSWDLRSSSITATKDGLVTTKNTLFRLFQIPVFWLPTFKTNMGKVSQPIFDYDLKWDSGMGPRISTRYQFFSWKNLALWTP